MYQTLSCKKDALKVAARSAKKEEGKCIYIYYEQKNFVVTDDEDKIYIGSGKEIGKCVFRDSKLIWE